MKRLGLALLIVAGCTLLLLTASLPCWAGFTDIGASLTGVCDCSLSWGDYDNDGDLDLALAGYAAGSPYYVTKIFRNDNGTFTDIGAALTGVRYASLAWGDYDNDGDLDLAISGYTGTAYVTRIYRNSNGTFADSGATLIGVDCGSLAWGDYDNDGDLDLAISGCIGAAYVTRIYRNSNGTFADSGAALIGVGYGSLAWGDYDNDGDLDLALGGDTSSSPYRVSKIYRNDNGTFVDVGAALVGVDYCSLAWGDYDNDGDLDLAIAGSTGGSSITRIYRNDNGTFTNIGAPVVGVSSCSLAWGDYDNDGDLDLAIAGYTGGSYVTKIYRNDNGAFTDSVAALTGVYRCSLAWADYDNDGCLDLAVAGYTGGSYIARIYKNQDSAAVNTTPIAPTGLSANLNASGLTLSWNASADAQTPAAGLSYNVRVGSTPGANDVYSGMANASTGLRQLPAIGSAQKNLTWTFKQLPSKSVPAYYWSVQAIDTAYAGSAWATEATISGHLISGQVTALGALPGVTVSADHGGTTTCTDAMGYYELFLPDGWSGSVTPAKAGYWFNPPHRDYPDGIIPPSRQDFNASSFVDSGVVLTGVAASPAWGDYNNDGNLDLAIAGATGSIYVTRIYRNDHHYLPDSVTFTDIHAVLTGVQNSSIAWGDYDNDGDLDLAVAGYSGIGRVTQIYRNDNGLFHFAGASLTGVEKCSIAWADYDNDGDLDLAVAGYTGSTRVSKIYRNDSGTFVDIGASLTGVQDCSLAWGDYDNDGDLDLAIAGYTGTARISKIYRNDNGVFTDISAPLTGLQYCSLAWGDYDNDGDLDLALAGYDGTSYLSKIYRNDAGTFADSGAYLTGVQYASLAWGDFDNDGDLDLAVAGLSATGSIGTICRNDNGTFTDLGFSVTGLTPSSIAWGDYNNDGNLDLAITGSDTSGMITKIYQNQGSAAANTAPNTPTGLSANLTAIGVVVLTWNAATDAQTPAAGLSYNIRVGSAPGGCDVFSGMADSLTGLRRLPAVGNAQKTLTWTLKNLPLKPAYYCSVQAIDTAFVGSAWAADVPAHCSKISGHVRTSAALAGVTVTASNGGGTVTTDSNGYYELALPVGWSGTVTPTKTACVFVPTNRAYTSISADQANQDFAASMISEVPASITGVRWGSLAWGDYDNDGDLDLAVAGHTGTVYLTKIYRNDNGTFTDIGAPLPGVEFCSLAWGDYDNDGDLDLAIAGDTGSSCISKVYRNDNGSFTDIGASLTGVYNSSLAWGDYDNDGDLDLAIAGQDASNHYTTKIYRNTNAAFTDVGAGLPGVYNCSLAWGDYDNDGDLDLAIAGNTGSTRISRIYRNDNGAFADIGAALSGVDQCSLAWGDYDSDGDLDLAIAGNTGSGYVTKIYRNSNGTFASIGAVLTGICRCSVAWGDYDNDGDLDLAIAGIMSSSCTSKVYRNDNGTFVDMGASLAAVGMSSLAWGDYDNNGNLDLALSGDTGSGYVTKIYRFAAGVFNTAPTPPTGLSASYVVNGLILTWSAASDAQTPAAGLAYNIRIGSTPGGNDIFSGMANASTGLRQLPALGNAQKKLTWTLKSMPAKRIYYCSVQAIDTAYAGSPWATEATAVVLRIAGYVRPASIASGVTIATDNNEIHTTTDATGYYELNVPIGWSGTVTPTKAGYWSTPASRSYANVTSDQMDQDFFATIDFKITGHVSPASIGSGVTVTASNSGASATADATGYYELNVSGGWSGTATPTKGGCWFTPASHSYASVMSDRTDQDFSSSALSDSGTLLPGLCYGSLAWGDYDNDGDLDLAVAGLAGGTTNISKIYRNDNGVLTDIGASLTAVRLCSLAWGDYDNDGDLDLAIAGGYTFDGTGATKIYRNDNGVFTDVAAALPGFSNSSLAWGDYDNDGDLDLAIAGTDGIACTTKIYRNDNGTFVDSGAALIGVKYCSLAWGDYDNDGDLDLAVSGYTGSTFVSKLYRNTDGVFTDVGAQLMGAANCSLAWGDYDNDGDLDLALAGYSGTAYISKIYRNDNGIFTDIGAPLTGVRQCSIAWGDYDNDGDLDLAIAGQTASGRISKIYRNDNGTFADSGAPLTAVELCSLAWADYDNNGGLDLMLTGYTGSGYITRIYASQGSAALNTPPTAPTGLWANCGAGSLTLGWSAATDAQTPAAGLSYNIRIGSVPGGCDLFAGMASSATGLRRLPAIGNAQKRLSWTIKTPHPLSQYYYSVQAIDSAFAGSAWATECLYADTALAKGLADGASVASSGIATAVFGDSFYIEKDNRTSGIRVDKPSHGVVAGNRVAAAGEIRTDGGKERYIAASTLATIGTAVVPGPLFMNPNAIGGGPLGLQSGVGDWRLAKDPGTGAWGREAANCGGANNIGLLVKVTGRVSSPSAGAFYLDGACSFDDGNPLVKGIRVDWPFADAMPADGAFIEMTAISSCTVNDGLVVRLLRPVSPSTIRTLQP
jgi:hypothetical protein